MLPLADNNCDIYILQEEPMDGCGDGMWNGVRYFTSRHEHGFFCPISLLVPDPRFAQTLAADINRKFYYTSSRSIVV